MVYIVFERTNNEEVIYGIYIKVPNEVRTIIEAHPDVFRVLPYEMKEDLESPFAG